jgi:pyrimidine operon attenuation protein/uracil phosphoribosyltransferase
MRQPKNVPKHHILILDCVVACSHIVHAAILELTLHRKPARSIELVVLVLGHPHVMVSEEGALGLDTTRCSEYLLRGER